MTSSDKRFLGILGGVTLVAAGGLVYWGMRGGSRYDEAASEFQGAADEVRRLEALKPYPKSENQNAKTEALKAYRESLGKVQEGFAKFRPEQLNNVASSEFAGRLLEVAGKAKAELEGSDAEPITKIPDNFALGFEKYTSNPVRQDATGLLGYQLTAIGEMFHLLAGARPTAVLNFMREPLPEETGQDYQPGEHEVARALPMELTFRGQERAFREFLNALVNSDQHYFVVRSLRVANERRTGPTAEEAKFKESKPAVIDPFAGAGFVFPGAEEETPEPAGGTETPAVEEPPAVEPPPADAGTPAGDAPAGEVPAGEVPAETVEPAVPAVPAPAPAEEDDSNRILKQLVGNEQVEVFLRIDLMLFHSDIELPQP